MFLKRDVIAKKYAQALLSLYSEQCDDQTLASLIALEQFFKKNKKISVYLSIPTIPEKTKEQVLDIILAPLKSKVLIKKLGLALLKKRRIEFFDTVLHHVIHLLYMKKNILQFKITTSHPLDQQERTNISNFLHKKTGASIIANFLVDKKLIVGIRIKGDYLLWERSLERLLQNIKLPFIQRARS